MTVMSFSYSNNIIAVDFYISFTIDARGRTKMLIKFICIPDMIQVKNEQR